MVPKVKDDLRYGAVVLVEFFSENFHEESPLRLSFCANELTVARAERDDFRASIAYPAIASSGST